MRVHVFLLTFLAASTLTSGAPASQESEVGNRLGEPQEAAASAAAAAQVYEKSLHSSAPPLPANSNRQPGIQGTDGNVYMAVSKWTLEMLYDFINRLYEKLKAIVSEYGMGGGGGGGGGTQFPGMETTRITNEDLRNLYSVLYVIYSLIQGNPASQTNVGPLPVPMNQQQQQQQPLGFGNQPTRIPAENFYSQFGAGANPLAFANAAAAAASSKVSNNRKRSYGSQASDLRPDEKVFRKVARKTVANILAKLDAMLAEKKKRNKVKEGDGKTTKVEIVDETPSTAVVVATGPGAAAAIAEQEDKAKKA